MSLNKIALLLTGILFILAGCGQTAEESIHNQLEEAVELEEDFRAQQSKITELEQQEQEIYEEIIELDTDEMDRIIELSEEALAIINEREEKLDVERESLELSQDAFQSIESDIDELEEDVRVIAEDMYETMEERYESYDALYNAYMESLESERELYTLLQDEELEQESLNETIETVNENYEDILTVNEQFNSYTIEYNELRKDFYEAADIEVSIVEEA